jgi:tRNA(His) guanylyltransferase
LSALLVRRARAESHEFEVRLRQGEWFHTLTVPPGVWTVIRVDGRGFSRLTEAHFDKPFDQRVRPYLVGAAVSPVTDLGRSTGTPRAMRSRSC